MDCRRMSCWVSDSIADGQFQGHEVKLKLVVFADSSRCSSCYINSLYQWQRIIDFEEQFAGFKVMFILGAKKGDTERLSEEIKKSTLSHPIYIDEGQNILTNNPNIPRESLYHTFLLDDNNNIILVGSPLHNETIDKLLLQILKEKLKPTTL